MDAKGLLRTRVLAARAARSESARSEAGRRLATHATVVVGDARVVGAYASVGDEPPTRPLLEALKRAGVEVLLPVVVGAELRWGRFECWSALVEGPYGLLQPATADADAPVDVVLVPGLAADTAGHRLGRGGGFYDRWLARARPSRVVAVVYDDELVGEVPVEPHDVAVDAVLTPRELRDVGQRDDVPVGLGEGDAAGDDVVQDGVGEADADVPGRGDWNPGSPGS